MGLINKYNSNTNIDYIDAYYKINNVNYYVDNYVEIWCCVYINAQSRLNNENCIEIVKFTVSKLDYAKYYEISNIELNNIIKQSYEFLKNTDEFVNSESN